MKNLILLNEKIPNTETNSEHLFHLEKILRHVWLLTQVWGRTHQGPGCNPESCQGHIYQRKYQRDSFLQIQKLCDYSWLTCRH